MKNKKKLIIILVLIIVGIAIGIGCAVISKNNSKKKSNEIVADKIYNGTADGSKDVEVYREKIIADYEAKVVDSQVKSAEQLKDKNILIIRVRGGLMNIYPAGVYLNPVLYEDLGAPVPEVVTAAEAQAELSLETLAEVNPDAIFLQFETSENADAPKALEELQANPIFQSLQAVQNEQVFINAIDPLAQGGTAWSKVKFLDAATENLINQ